MPEDNKKDMYDALIKSHHEMISKMYEDALRPIMQDMYKHNLNIYVDKVAKAIQSVGKIVNSGDKH